jgi:primosomal protein N' (replication factor Y)
VEPVRERCSQCGSAELVHGGVGTERVELTLAAEFPRLRFLRLDRDAARGNRLLETLERFRRGEADVLVGTQMLSKGHDFPNVTLVGVLQGDHGLALPDPRAAERTFALLTQVAGRAGRGTRAGRVVIQAFAVHHPVIVAAQTHDYEAFAREELAARQRLGNPPFGYLALLRVHGSDDSAVSTRIGELAERLQAGALEVATKHPDEPEIVRLLGPVPAPIARINQQTRWQLLVRAKARAPLRYLLAGIRPLLGASSKAGLQTLAFVDVDPHSLL